MPSPKIYRSQADHFDGTTKYTNGKLRTYSNTLTTDSNGRITVNLTENGLVGGVPLFSDIFVYSALGFDGSGNALQGPFFIIESASTTQVVFRGIRGRSQGFLIGGTIVPVQFVGSGYSVNVFIQGLKP